MIELRVEEVLSKIISPIQKEFIDSIHSALKSEYQNSNLLGLKNKLNKINKDAWQKLKKEDAICIYAATSVAYSSYQYWKKNIVKLAYLFTSYNIGGDKCKEIIGASKVNFSKSIRYKADGNMVELSDGSWLDTDPLCDVIISAQQTHIWENTIMPIINADSDAAACQIATNWYYQYMAGEISEATFWGSVGTAAIIGSIYMGVKSML